MVPGHMNIITAAIHNGGGDNGIPPLIDDHCSALITSS